MPDKDSQFDKLFDKHSITMEEKPKKVEYKYRYIDNEEELAKAYGTDLKIEMDRLDAIDAERLKDSKRHNAKCHVCKKTFEAYFKTTKKCSLCELDYKSNV